MKKHEKEQVISVGEKLFRSKGYHNTGTEDILKESEYPRSSFYYHFKSKEGFAIQVLENYGANSEKLYRDILMNSKIGSPVDRLKHFAQMLTEMSVQKKFTSECLIQKLSIECAGINDGLRQVINNQMNRLLTVVNECIAEGQSLNEIRSDIPSEELAEYYHSQLYGGFILSRLQQNGKVMNKGLHMAIENMSK
ncbi:TetR/AcrR family transcriptional regulator [Roseivirga sp. E12]|uniref:TetR/AcrR family transcriptional regulator n=1 Tax=Roseivirga sp. E12 TaxID=2819237 RepID=UPI001ABC5737|nr:TetR/AcrR family transcriptional regulator [Roseivirga sp. E12]MBO3697539.1 TetR/AcrR family transcriptional regulator [Roseivirga sp. E12]